MLQYLINMLNETPVVSSWLYLDPADSYVGGACANPLQDAGFCEKRAKESESAVAQVWVKGVLVLAVDNRLLMDIAELALWQSPDPRYQEKVVIPVIKDGICTHVPPAAE